MAKSGRTDNAVAERLFGLAREEVGCMRRRLRVGYR